MNEQDENIEIKPVEPSETSTPEGYTAKAGGKAEVTLRLLTQEEFDRLPKPEAKKEE
jgi:hypothetical protein